MFGWEQTVDLRGIVHLSNLNTHTDRLFLSGAAAPRCLGMWPPYPGGRARERPSGCGFPAHGTLDCASEWTRSGAGSE